eukprot:m.54312 g.54312  ORF g.54312 m.54312 type:complete len:196 (+) comp13240_c0_seq1:188-775(+)
MSGEGAEAASLASYGPSVTTAAEIEFLAEDSLVTVTPNFESGVLMFIGGEVGPLRPQLPAAVPLWLAIALKRRHKCQIVPPEWLGKDELTRLLEAERTSDAFTKLPDHYQEISALLFRNAADNIPDATAVQTLMKDLEDVRASKIRRTLVQIKDSAAVRLNNLSHMEINTIRPFFVHSMNAFHRLQDGYDAAAAE